MQTEGTVLSWLLQESNPSVRYRTLTELLEIERVIERPRVRRDYDRDRTSPLSRFHVNAPRMITLPEAQVNSIIAIFHSS